MVFSVRKILVKMKVSCLLLLIHSMPMAFCRLNRKPKIQVKSDVSAEHRASNATNKISYFQKDGLQVIEVIKPEWNESPPEVPNNATFNLYLAPELADVNSRRQLQSTMTVVIENQCSQASFYLAIKYNQGTVTEGWFLIRYGQSVSFDVEGSEFAIYATSEDGQYVWQCTSNCNTCVSGRCFKEYSIPGNPTKSIHYLSCGSIFSNPGPSPTAAPPVSSTTGRPLLWEDAHNNRRATLHNTKVQWNWEVANSAQNYAAKLAAINGCTIRHGYQGDNYGGENLAANWGGSNEPPDPDSVLTRWFDEEKDLAYPDNGHYSQVGWKATRYIGCGEATKSHEDGHCFIQVCRYITPGNCNLGSAPLEELMLRDTSPCEPQSP